MYRVLLKYKRMQTVSALLPEVKMSNLKYGIMGGTFNPIHNAHIRMAEEVRDIFDLDKIIFMPTGTPPHKNNLNIDPLDRYEMTKLAISGNDRFEVSDIEILNKSISYTVETVGKLKEFYPNVEFYFITGADSILDIYKWRNPEKLLTLCKFVSVRRPNYSDDLEGKIKEIVDKFGGEILLVDGPLLNISSTEIRERVREGKSIEDFVPKKVVEYIKENKLYI